VYMNDIIRSEDRAPGSPSGRFVLRLDPALHARLRDTAGRLDISLNEYCSRILAAPGSRALVPAGEVIQRLHARFGRNLAGVVVYGSWARGELVSTSDVDLLVVLSPDVPIRRSLYREWDDDDPRWDGRVVEPHFVHLAGVGGEISGTWAEAAVEGIVLLDPELTISRRLMGIRRRIAEGEIVRRLVHGQPYWVQAA